jgi:hypothetical protein
VVPVPVSVAGDRRSGGRIRSTAVFVVLVGSSKTPTKTVVLPEAGLWINDQPCNQQVADWRDTFKVTVVGNKLTVTRTDLPAGLAAGWDQPLELEATRTTSPPQPPSPRGAAFADPDRQRSGGGGGGGDDRPGRASWKAAAGRADGKQGYVFFDVSRAVFKSGGKLVQNLLDAPLVSNIRKQGRKLGLRGLGRNRGRSMPYVVRSSLGGDDAGLAQRIVEEEGDADGGFVFVDSKDPQEDPTNAGPPEEGAVLIGRALEKGQITHHEFLQMMQVNDKAGQPERSNSQLPGSFSDIA